MKFLSLVIILLSAVHAKALNCTPCGTTQVSIHSFDSSYFVLNGGFDDLIDIININGFESAELAKENCEIIRAADLRCVQK